MTDNKIDLFICKACKEPENDPNRYTGYTWTSHITGLTTMTVGFFCVNCGYDNEFDVSENDARFNVLYVYMDET